MTEFRPVDEQSDSALVQASRMGDLAAWEQLMQRHLPALGAYIGARLRRPDVVDRLLVQAVAQAWKHLDSLGDVSELPRWLRKMGANVALRWHKEHPHEELAEILPAIRCAGSALPAGHLRRLDAALGQLPAEQRMVLEQRFRGGVHGEALWRAVHVDAQRGKALLGESLRALDQAMGDLLT